jgi:hypothetical protein
MPRRKSDARTGAPVEYRIPRRSVNVYVVPPSAGRGSGGDERDLNQVLGQGAVATGKHTGVPEQARSARGEAVGKLPGMIHRDPAIAHLSLRQKIRGSSRHPASPADTAMTVRVPWKGQHPCATPRCKSEISFMFLGRTRTANPLALSWYASSRRRRSIRRRRYWPFRPYAP